MRKVTLFDPRAKTVEFYTEGMMLKFIAAGERRSRRHIHPRELNLSFNYYCKFTFGNKEV